MPLIKSKTQKAFVKNIRAELESGTPKSQAIAIAYAVQRETKKRTTKKK